MTLIVEGVTVAEAAAGEGIRASIARTHLQRVFDKIGVRNEVALVRAMLSVPERNPTT